MVFAATLIVHEAEKCIECCFVRRESRIPTTRPLMMEVRRLVRVSSLQRRLPSGARQYPAFPCRAIRASAWYMIEKNARRFEVGFLRFDQIAIGRAQQPVHVLRRSARRRHVRIGLIFSKRLLHFLDAVEARNARAGGKLHAFKTFFALVVSHFTALTGT